MMLEGVLMTGCKIILAFTNFSLPFPNIYKHCILEGLTLIRFGYFELIVIN